MMQSPPQTIGLPAREMVQICNLVASFFSLSLHANLGKQFVSNYCRTTTQEKTKLYPSNLSIYIGPNFI
jgi:hypothetical protein